MIAELAEPQLSTSINHKRCSQCKVDRPTNHFGKNRQTATGLSYICLACNRENTLKYQGKKEVTKTCGTCKEAKAVKEYSKATTQKDGLQPACKGCNKAYHRQYTQIAKERVTLALQQQSLEGTKHFRMTQKINGMTLKPSKAQESGTTHAQRLLTTLLDLTDRTTQLIGELQFAVTSNSL